MEGTPTKSRAPNSIDKHVGLRVRNRRLRLRLSQTELGAAIGVTFQQIQKYENGTNRLASSNLYRIAAALGVDIAYLFAGMSDETTMAGLSGKPMPLAKPADELKQAPLNSLEAFDFAVTFQRISDPRVRRQVSRFVKALANSPTDA